MITSILLDKLVLGKETDFKIADQKQRKSTVVRLCEPRYGIWYLIPWKKVLEWIPIRCCHQRFKYWLLLIPELLFITILRLNVESELLICMYFAPYPDQDSVGFSTYTLWTLQTFFSVYPSLFPYILPSPLLTWSVVQANGLQYFPSWHLIDSGRELQLKLTITSHRFLKRPTAAPRNEFCCWR